MLKLIDFHKFIKFFVKHIKLKNNLIIDLHIKKLIYAEINWFPQIYKIFCETSLIKHILEIS